MDGAERKPLELISVVFEDRPDGGLRVYSDDVPGFALSHSDRNAVLSDVQPALEAIIAGMIGMRVSVTPVSPDERLPWSDSRHRRMYEAKKAAA